MSTSGPAFFITHAVLRRPDGTEVEWTSRRQRKQLGVRATATDAAGHPNPPLGRVTAAVELVDGRPVRHRVALLRHRLDPALLRQRLPRGRRGATFCDRVGLLHGAASVQYARPCTQPTRSSPTSRSVERAGGRSSPGGRTASTGGRPRSSWPARCCSTSARSRQLGSTRVDHDKHLVWAPDVFGSVCFLIASGLAYAEVNRRWWPRSDGSVGVAHRRPQPGRARSCSGCPRSGPAWSAAAVPQPTSLSSTRARASVPSASSPVPCCCRSSRPRRRHRLTHQRRRSPHRAAARTPSVTRSGNYRLHQANKESAHGLRQRSDGPTCGGGAGAGRCGPRTERRSTRRRRARDR